MGRVKRAAMAMLASLAIIAIGAPVSSGAAKAAVTLNSPDVLHHDGAELSWTAYSGTGFTSYEVHRSGTAGFTPSSATKIATITSLSTTTYRDTGASPLGTYSYKIVVAGAASNEQRLTLPADGQTTQIVGLAPASAATYIWGDWGTGGRNCPNTGADATLEVGAKWTTGPPPWAQIASSGVRALLKFDLQVLPSTAAVQSARLHLWHGGARPATETDVHLVTRDWSEGTGSFNNQCAATAGATWQLATGAQPWASPGGDYSATPDDHVVLPAASQAGWDTFDLTESAQAWLSGTVNYGLLLRHPTDGDWGGPLSEYASDDAADATLRPKVYVTYYDWGVAPGYYGPTFASGAEAAAADPPPPTDVTTSLPTWRNLYDWPNGDGYVGWHNASSRPSIYGLASNHGGNRGLWVWPVGGDYSDGDFAEWTYAAPGTTRIHKVDLNFAYRNKLLAHHCIAIGLRTASTIVTQKEWCKPAKPPDSQRDVSLRLVDPSTNPTSKTLFFRVRMDCKNTPGCTKHVSSHDPLVNGGYARLKFVDMVLVDDDVPELQFFDELQMDVEKYAVTLSASDPGSGVQRITLEHVGEGIVATGNAPCDPHHNTLELDNRICPQNYSFSTLLDTTAYANGSHTFVARAYDVAGNVGTIQWSVVIDRSEPTPPTQVTFGTPVTVADALAFARSQGMQPLELVSEIAAGTDTLTISLGVDPASTDAELIAETPEGLFSDLEDSGQNLWAYYQASPLVNAMLVRSATFHIAKAPFVAAFVQSATVALLGKPRPAECQRPWWPDTGRIDTLPSRKTAVMPGTRGLAPVRYVYQLFSWSSTNLQNLNCDADSTYEPDAYYYRADGKSYLGPIVSAGWRFATNLPASYLDTQAFDKPCCQTFTVGTSDAHQLRPRPQRYFTVIRAFHGNATVDQGKPAAQSGYHRFSFCGRISDAWCVFPRATETLMQNITGREFEHTVPGSDAWTH
jgi:hypothetical protein